MIGPVNQWKIYLKKIPNSLFQNQRFRDMDRLVAKRTQESLLGDPQDIPTIAKERQPKNKFRLPSKLKNLKMMKINFITLLKKKVQLKIRLNLV